MKKIRCNRREILSAIRISSAIIGMAFGRHLAADPVYTAPYYAIDGSKVQGSGISSSAYFHDSTTASYAVNVLSSADLSTSTASELQFNSGSVTNDGALRCSSPSIFYGNGWTVALSSGTVTNHGSIAYTGSGYYGAAISLFNGTVRNFGTITSASGYGIYVLNGTVYNEASGVIASGGTNHFNSPVYIDGSGLLVNKGSITNTTSFYSVIGDNYCTVKNTGTIVGICLGASNIFGPRHAAVGQSSQNSNLVINSGTIYQGYGAAISINSSNGHVENLAGGEIDGYISMLDGTISNAADATLNGACGLFSGAVTNAGSTTSGIYFEFNGQVTNTGSISGENNPEGIDIGSQGTVHNFGNIVGQTVGVILRGDQSFIETSGGNINSPGDAIELTGQNSAVTIEGQAAVHGVIEGTNSSYGNVLHFKLTGLTASQTENFKAYVASHTNSGSYTFAETGRPLTYTWKDFANVTD